VTLLPTSGMAELGSVFVIATSRRILSAKSVRSKASLLLLKKYTTNFLYQKVETMKGVTSWPFVSHVTRGSLQRVATDGKLVEKIFLN
jgi:hypothetical protein